MPRVAVGAQAASTAAIRAARRAACMRVEIIRSALAFRLRRGGVRIVNQLTDQAFQNHCRFGEADLVAGLEILALAPELERDIAVAEDAGGDDRGGRIGRDLQALVEIQVDAG